MISDITQKYLWNFYKNADGMIFLLRAILKENPQEDSMQGKVELSGVNTAQLPVIPQAQMENLLLLAKGGDE